MIWHITNHSLNVASYGMLSSTTTRNLLPLYLMYISYSLSGEACLWYFVLLSVALVISKPYKPWRFWQDWNTVRSFQYPSTAISTGHPKDQSPGRRHKSWFVSTTDFLSHCCASWKFAHHLLDEHSKLQLCRSSGALSFLIPSMSLQVLVFSVLEGLLVCSRILNHPRSTTFGRDLPRSATAIRERAPDVALRPKTWDMMV